MNEINIKFFFLFQLLFQIIKSQQSCFEYSCEECTNSNYGSCTKCKKDFILIDGTCPCYDSNCAMCKSSYPLTDCYFCKNNIINFMNNCICLINNCEICGKYTCLKCYFGYTYNPTKKICEKNESLINSCYDENCNSCSFNEEGYCESCKNGYYLEQGRCKPLMECVKNQQGECVSCLDDKYYLNSDGYCHEKCFGHNCNGAQLDDTFYTCEDKCVLCNNYQLFYYVDCKDEDKCTINNCALCKNQYDCYYCYSGYFKKDGLCYKCSNNCLKCNNENQCIVCNDGYKLNDNGTCDLININDEEYSDLIEYFERYSDIKKDLIKFFEDINSDKDKDKDNNNKDDIKEINEPEKNKCEIDNCNQCSKTNYCMDCEPNYELINGNCYQNNCIVENCEECNEKDNCSKCKEDYNLIYNENTNSNICQKQCKDQNCLQCVSNNLCIKCIDNYISNGYSCNIKCSDEHCSYCSETNKCETCSSGYYLNDNNKCIKCSIENCLECPNNICQKCKRDFSLIDDNCLDLCETIDNCQYCIHGSNKCIQCDKGCKLNKNGKCDCKKKISLFAIIFILIITILLILIVFMIYLRKKKFNEENNSNIITNRIISSRVSPFQQENNDSKSYNNLRERYNNEFNDNQVETSEKDYLGFCDVCKDKRAKYITDCGCSLCEEHCLINEKELNINTKENLCPVCGKIVNNQNLKKGQCGICFQNKVNLIHFKCHCALFVCRNCYIKCKLQSQNCPACRGDIS